MRIGYDTLVENPLNPSSAINYIKSVLYTMVEVGPEHEYFVFVSPKNRHLFDIRAANVHLINCFVSNENIPLRILVQQLYYPKALIVVENNSVPFDRRVWREAQTLREAGWQVVVISPKAVTYSKGGTQIQGVLLLNQLSAVKNTVIPSKLLTYMAAGLPVLAAVNAESQGAELLRASAGGVLPENPGALIEGLKGLMNDKKIREEMGERNKTYALENFDRKKILKAQEVFLMDVARGRSGEKS